MQIAIDPLYQEAARFLQKHYKKQIDSLSFPDYSNFSSELSLKQFYIYTCIYTLRDPRILCKGVEVIQHQGAQSVLIFLKSLRIVSLCYSQNSQQRQLLKAIYRTLLDQPNINKILIENCLLPDFIEPFPKQKQKVANKSKLMETRMISKKKTDDFNQSTQGCAKIILTLSQINAQKPDCQRIWQKMMAYFGAYVVSTEKLINTIVQTTFSMKKYRQCVFFLCKIIEIVGMDALLQIIIPNSYYKTSTDGKDLQVRGKLQQMMDFYQVDHMRQNKSIRILCLLIKSNDLNQLQIFGRLSPDFDEMAKLSMKKYEVEEFLLAKESLARAQQTIDTEKYIWGQMTKSTKISLLIHLVMLNSLDKFKKIYRHFKLQTYGIYDSELTFALTELYEWVIDKVYQKCSFSRFFTLKNDINKRYLFPEGYFRQSQTVDSHFVEAITQIFTCGGIFIFARRSTFIKTCRLCQYLVTKMQKLKDIGKKAYIIITSIIRKLLIPALQFYKKDPSVSMALNDLINCFDRNKQQLILLGSIKNRQTIPLQLIAIHAEVVQDLNRLLNRLSKQSLMVFKRLKDLLICNSLSCIQQIVSRVVNFNLRVKEIVERVLIGGNELGKKMLCVYVLLQVTTNEKILVSSSSSLSEGYENLIAFINHFLLYQADSHILSLFVQYFAKKLYQTHHQQKQIVELTNFEYFHGQINFLTALVTKAFPIQLSMASDTPNNIQLTAGVYLQSVILNQHPQLIQATALRRQIINYLFSEEQILQCPFYKIINNICLQLRSTLENKEYNIPLTAKLYDQGLCLILLLVRMVHFEIKEEQEIKRCFSLNLLNCLLNNYNIPLELAFMILRKSFILSCNNTNKKDRQQWFRIKEKCFSSLYKYYLTGNCEKKEACNKVGLDVIGRKKIISLTQRDLFCLFWLCDLESLFYNESLYQKHISKFEEKAPEDPRADDLSSLLQEQKKQLRGRFDLLRGNGDKNTFNVFPKTLNPMFRLSNSEEFEYIDLFLKQCIVGRALLSQSDVFYSWNFLMQMMKHNKVSAVIFISVICRLNCQLSMILHFTTSREASNLISMLANQSSDLMKYEESRSQLQHKLVPYFSKIKLVTSKDFRIVMHELYECHQQIIDNLTRCDEQLYSVKNSLAFLKKVKFIPFVKQHTPIIMAYLDKIYTKYGVFSQDISNQVDLVKVEINKRDMYLKTFKEQPNIVNVESDSLNFSESQASSEDFDCLSRNSLLREKRGYDTEDYCNQRYSSRNSSQFSEQQSDSSGEQYLKGEQNPLVEPDNLKLEHEISKQSQKPRYRSYYRYTKKNIYFTKGLNQKTR